MPADYDEIRNEIIRRRGEETDHLDIYWEQYSDKTHFIYEILQNAEDTEANKIFFVLNNYELRILHDGRIFVENDDNKDVTGICDIKKSGKESDLRRIGKLGMGFKSVYAYTDIPKIFSGEEHFRIEQLIRPFYEEPQPIPEGFTTLLILSLKKEIYEEAYSQISERLSDIGIRTLLFLRHIKEINFEIYNNSDKIIEGCYFREIEMLNNKTPIIRLIGEKIDFTKSELTETEEENWLVFSKKIPLEVDLGDDHPRVNVAFLIDMVNGENNIRRAGDTYLNVFFPTHETTGLGFIIQGPYKTTPNRSEIPPKDNWNKELIELTNDLIHDSLNEIIKAMLVVPSVSLIEALQVNRDAIRNEMLPLFEVITGGLSVDLKTLPLLPADDGSFVSVKNARLPETNDVRRLLRNSLSEYIGSDYEIKWISETITAESDKTKNIFYFLENELNVDKITFDSMCRRITNDDSHFLKNRIANIDWFIDFYKSLYEKAPLKKQRWQGDSNGWMRTRKIIITDNNELVQPFKADGSNNVFLPADILTSELTINRKLLASHNQDMAEFFEWLKITQPDTFDIVEKTILNKYGSEKAPVIKENIADISQILKGLAVTGNNEKKNQFIKNLLQIPFIIGFDKNADKICYEKPSQLCMDSLLAISSGLSDFFSIHHKYEVWPGYKNEECFPNNVFQDFLSFVVEELKVMHSLSVIKVSAKNNSRIKKSYYITHYETDIDYSIENIEDYLKIKSIKASIMVWNAIINTEPSAIWAKYRPNGSTKIQIVESQLVQYLKNYEWIPAKSGEFKKPEDMTKAELPPEFIFDENNEIIKAIGFGRKAEQSLEVLQQKQEFATELGASVEEINELQHILKATGLTIADLIEKVKISRQIFPKTDRFPNRPVPDPDRRRDGMSRKIANAEEKLYENRQRRVRVSSSSSSGEKPYLEYHYTNENVMYCQICKKEMPFKKRNGDYYYESVEVLSKKYLPKENKEQYLALCPECSARYNEYILHDDSIMAELKDHIINETEMSLNLGGVSENNHEPFVVNIYFEKAHLLDVQEILKADKGGQNG
jgi:hypothetical protein